MTRSGTARSRPWWCPRWPTSPSTCRTPRSPSRCPARSVPGRRRRSGWAGSCGPRTTAGRRTSTRSSPGTPWTPTTRRTGSGSWPSRGTPTGSSTPTTCSGRRCRGRRSRPTPGPGVRRSDRCRRRPNVRRSARSAGYNVGDHRAEFPANISLRRAPPTAPPLPGYPRSS